MRKRNTEVFAEMVRCILHDINYLNTIDDARKKVKCFISLWTIFIPTLNITVVHRHFGTELSIFESPSVKITDIISSVRHAWLYEFLRYGKFEIMF